MLNNGNMNLDRKAKLLQITNILTPIVTFCIVAIISFLNGADLETFDSGTDASLIDPAGFAFAIWGPIFLFLALFILFQSKGLFRLAPENPLIISQVSVFFSLSTIMASAWWLFWSFGYVAMSTFSMMLYLGSILAAYIRLKINLIDRSKKEFYMVSVPWSMYAGWVTAATIVSITTFMEDINFNEPPMVLSDVGWAIVVLLTTLGIYLTVVIRQMDGVYGGVGIWVLIAVIVQRISDTPVVLEIIILAAVGIVVLIIAIFYIEIKRKKSKLNAEI